MKLRITLEGVSYEVDVEFLPEAAPPAAPPVKIAPRPIPPPPPPFSRRVPKSDDKTCRSPLAGVVSSIAVAVGQKVEKNAPLLVIEAMKMETKIVAQAPGIIKTVQVSAGEAVKPGQVLIELE